MTKAIELSQLGGLLTTSNTAITVDTTIKIDEPSGNTATLTVQTQANSGNDAVIKIRGARTAAPDNHIAMLQFDNKTTSAYTMATISARDFAGDHDLGDGSLLFRTSDNGTLSDSMTILSGGKVGIGTTSPSSLLHVDKASTVSYPFSADVSGAYSYTPYPQEIFIRNTSDGTTNGFCGIFFNPGRDTDGSKQATARITAIDSGNYQADIAFGTRDTDFAERMRITCGGSVGIGTAAPGAKLHVYTKDGDDEAFYVEDELEGDVFTAGGVGGHVTVNNRLYIGGTTNYFSSQPTGTYGSVQINGGGKGNWEGYSINGRAIFMHDGGSIMGLYDDVNNHWAVRHDMGGASITSIRSGNNVDTIVCTGTNQVGIGTATVARGPLHIHQGTTGDTQIHMTNSETGTASTDGFTIFTGGSDGSHSGFVNREASARIRFLMDPLGGSNVTDQMVLLADGNLGLGISDPTEKLHLVGGKMLLTGAVLSGTNHSAIRSEATIDTVNRDTVFNLRLQTTMTDAGTTTGDREQGGVYNFITNNATGGGTSHEQRVYGVWNDINNYGDADQLYGTWDGLDSYHTSGTISSMYGSYSLIQHRGAGNITNMYGTYGLAQPTTGSSGSVSKLVGVRGRANVAGTSSVTLTDQWGVWGNIDNDANVVASGIVSCFYGTYDTTGDITRPYGIYMGTEDLSHYLSGVLGVGNASDPKSYTNPGALHIGDETTAATTNDIVFGKRVTTDQTNLPRIGHCDILGTATNNDLGINACSSGGNIGFFTGNGGAGYGAADNELRMIIEASGNVGIGTNNAANKLDVYGNAFIGAGADITPGSTGAGQIMIKANGYTPYIAANSDAMHVGHNSSTRELRFQTNEATRMYIAAAGSNVGIGTTTTASYALSVRNVTAPTTTGGIFIDCNDWSTNTSENAFRVDVDSTSTVNLSANRSHYGVHSSVNLRVPSNASTTTGTRQTVIGGYISAQLDDTSSSDGKSYALYGVYGRARIDGINASNVRGVYALTQAGDNGSGTARTIDSAYGSFSLVLNDGNQTTITNAYAVYAHCNQDDTGGAMTNAHGVYSRVDRDSGTGGTGYAYRGSFEGTWTSKRGLWITGDTENSVAGSFAAASKTFRIPHPIPELSETKDLVHVSVEAPAHDLIYRGRAELVDGSATANLDTESGMTEGTFVALCRNVQCFTSNESDWSAVRGSVSGNVLTIECQDSSSTATISWLVVGERQDDKVKSLVTTDAEGNLILEPDQEPEEEDQGKPIVDLED